MSLWLWKKRSHEDVKNMDSQSLLFEVFCLPQSLGFLGCAVVTVCPNSLLALEAVLWYVFLFTILRRLDFLSTQTHLL